MASNAAWMKDRLSELGDRRFLELTLPGAHDAGMYRIDRDRLEVSFDVAGHSFQDISLSVIEHLGPLTALGIAGTVATAIGGLAQDHLAITQQLSFKGQLEQGVRYLDLRPKRMDSHWYAHHTATNLNLCTPLGKRLPELKVTTLSVTGPRLDEVLGELAAFLQAHRELVLLDLSDVRPGAGQSDLIGAVEGVLGRWLFRELPTGQHLAKVTLGEFLESGSRVIVRMFDSKRSPRPGFWGKDDLNHVGGYTDTDDLAKMKEDQKRKFKGFGEGDPERNETDLFLLAWTLTIQFHQMGIGSSIRALAEIANGALLGELPNLRGHNEHGRVINIVEHDFVGRREGVIDAIIEMNDAG